MIQKILKAKKRAFTLVEVMIAIGILSVSLTALIGLLSAISTKVAEVRNQSKAISVVTDLEVILKSKSFDQVYDWVRTARQPYVVYFWDEYANFEEVDDPSLVSVSSETPGKRLGAPPNAEDLKKADGNIYRAVLTLSEEALKGRFVNLDDPEREYGGGSLPESSDLYGEAFLPINVEVLVDPVDDIVSGAGDEDQNNQRRVYSDLIVKMR